MSFYGNNNILKPLSQRETHRCNTQTMDYYRGSTKLKQTEYTKKIYNYSHSFSVFKHGTRVRHCDFRRSLQTQVFPKGTGGHLLPRFHSQKLPKPESYDVQINTTRIKSLYRFETKKHLSFYLSKVSGSPDYYWYTVFQVKVKIPIFE